MYLARVVIYALVAMISTEELSRETDAPITIKCIAGNTGIPLEYLRKIARQLVRANVFQSVRGRNGGVRLARLPNEISVREVIEAVGERLDAPDALDNWPGDTPPNVDLSAFVERCRETRAVIQQCYETTTFADLLPNGSAPTRRSESGQTHSGTFRSDRSTQPAETADA